MKISNPETIEESEKEFIDLIKTAESIDNRALSGESYETEEGTPGGLRFKGETEE